MDNLSKKENERTLRQRVFFWLLYHAGLFAFSIITALIIKYFQKGEIDFTDTGIIITIIFLISVILGYLANYLVRKGSRLSHAELKKRIVPYFLIFLLLSFIIANLIVSAGVLYYYISHDLNMQEFLSNLLGDELPYASKSIIVWLMLFSIVFFYVLWRRSASKEQSLREEKLKYQYQTLKAQINPHFLFNSFGTLTELVYDDPKKADNYIQELSGIYRYILENEDTRLIALEKELDFVGHYFQLQQERLHNKLKLEINIEDPDQFSVVPVSLHSLVENAIKHNSASESEPLFIEINQAEDYLQVRNNLRKKATMEPTTRKGLANLNEQLKLILGKELIVSQDQNSYIVKLPMGRKA